jgi:Skp family chaperone for outer membrane proteins
MSQQMKTSVLTLALLCITFCLPQNGQAQDAKIAVVDTQALTIASDEGKAVNEKIEKRIQAMGTEMEKLRKDIEGKEERLRTQDRVMSATLKAQLQGEIKEDQIKFERKNQDYQKEIEEMQNQIFGPIAAKVKVELGTYVNEMGYHLLIDISAENGNVVWANEANNITKQVMVRMNDAYKKAGGAASAAAAPPAPAASR